MLGYGRFIANANGPASILYRLPCVVPIMPRTQQNRRFLLLFSKKKRFALG